MSSGEAMPRTGQLIRDLRRTPMFRQVVPMESGIGWPIPVRHRDGETHVYARLPLYGLQRADAVTNLFPPFAMITVHWPEGRVVEFADFTYSRPWPAGASAGPAGVFPHEAVRGMTTRDYMTERDRVLAGYDELLDSLRAGQPFTARDEFATLLRRLLEPGLEPYYRALGPRFFDQFLGPGPAVSREQTS